MHHGAATEMLEERIRERAYHLWEASGRSPVGDQEFGERARGLIAIENHLTEVRVRSPRSRSACSATSVRRSK